MHIYSKLKQLIYDSIKHKFSDFHELETNFLNKIVLEKPKGGTDAHLSSNAVMQIYSKLKRSNHVQDKFTSREIGEMLAEDLKRSKYIHKIEIAGPGFINFWIANEFWQQELKNIIMQGCDYGSHMLRSNLNVNLEYVSANPTGPVHIGHARGAIVGDVMASILKYSGAKVCKEYYINDAGNQVTVLAKSVLVRLQQLDAGHTEFKIDAGLYPGEYLHKFAQSIYQEFKLDLKNFTEEDLIKKLKPKSVSAMMALIQEDLSLLGINHDHFVSEQTLRESGIIEKALNDLKKKDLLYSGNSKAPIASHNEEKVEGAEQILFKSTNFGDDLDRVVIKANDELTYFAADIGYAQHKLNRKFDNYILILGADHIGYHCRLKSAFSAISNNEKEYDIRTTQLVNFIENGVPIKMSKRSGKFATLRGVVEEIGPDAVRYMMLMRRTDSIIDFDLQKVKEMNKDNPYFYVQYANVRINSAIAKAEEIFDNLFESIDSADLSLLSNESELRLLRELMEWNQLIVDVVETLEPHKLINYLNELATCFHSLWNYSSAEGKYKFVVEQKFELTKSRVYMLKATQQIIINALKILGIKPLEKM